MHNSKLIRILQAFSPEEVKEFRKFIDSSFFNKEGAYIVRVFDELKKYYPQFENEAIAKEKLFKKIYKDKPYSDALMRKAGSALIKLAVLAAIIPFWRRSGGGPAFWAP